MSYDKDILRELKKQTQILQALADHWGVPKPEKNKTVTLDNDLVVSITKNAIEHTVTAEDSAVPRQVRPDPPEPDPNIGSGVPFRGDDKTTATPGEPFGPRLAEEHMKFWDSPTRYLERK